MNFCKELVWRCRSIRPVHHVDLLGLIHLYQPMIGTSGVALYLTLHYQLPLHKQGISDLQQHSLLLRLCSLSFQQMLDARYLLEGVGLLNCYEKNDPFLGEHYEYELIPPLTPRRFFQSDVLSVSLFNILGKEKFLDLKSQFEECEEPCSETGKVTNITKSFQDVFGSLSPDQLEKTAEIAQEIGCLTENINEELSQGKYPEYKSEHDFSLIKLRLSSLVAEEVWTEELIKQLREVSFLYQLDEWDLLKALQNPYVTSNNTIDIDRLRSFVKNEYRLRYGRAPVISRLQQMETAVSEDKIPKTSGKTSALTEEEKHIQQLSGISPLELLSHYQGGAKVPDSDMELVNALIYQYRLPSGVINVLLEYVLLKYDYRLPRNLVEKIAGHWKRLGIATAEAAMVQARKEDWDLKKKKTSPGTYRKNVKIESSPLPKAVAKQLEMKKKAQQQSAPQEYTRDELAKKKAQIEAKIKMLYETPIERDNEKENWS